MRGLPDVRRKLDRLNDQIIGRLQDRSRFLLNTAIYRPDGIHIEGKEGVRFLDHALAGLETYHATLGRFRFPDQYPLHPEAVTEAPVKWSFDMPAIPAVNLSIQDHVIDFYVKLLPAICESGDDTTTYGEAAYVDADIVVLIHERINMGRYVAYFKFMQDPTVLNLLAQPEQLRAALTVKKREDEVISAAMRSAEQRGLDIHIIAKMFRWMIDETLDLEVEYLRLLKG